MVFKVIWPTALQLLNQQTTKSIPPFLNVFLEKKHEEEEMKEKKLKLQA